MAKDQGFVTFKGVTYTLGQKDIELIVDALEIVNPDTDAQTNRARLLRNKFHALANASGVDA